MKACRVKSQNSTHSYPRDEPLSPLYKSLGGWPQTLLPISNELFQCMAVDVLTVLISFMIAKRHVFFFPTHSIL